MKMEELNKQNLKVLNATKALQIIILTWALRTKTTNSRVSFIDLYMYLVFPKNFKIVFLPNTNKVILLGPYCGTDHRAWVTCEYTRERIFLMTIVHFLGHFLRHFTLLSQQFYHRSPQKRTKQTLTQHWKTTESIW